MHPMKPIRPFVLSSQIRALSSYFLLFFAFFIAKDSFSQQVFQFAGTTAANTGVTTQNVSVPITSSGTVGDVRVLSAGIADLDFVQGAGTATCQTGSNFSAGDICSIEIKFQPKSAGERRGAVVLLDTHNAVMGMLPLYGRATGPIAVFLPGIITTAAGSGQWLYKDGVSDGIGATAAPLFLPSGVVLDAAGNMYISDSNNNRIRWVNRATNVIYTVAGDGSPGSANDGAAATLAQVNNPSGLLLDGAGDLYIADSGNHAIRKLVHATGKLITIAGQLGTQGFAGDNGPAKLAYLNTPEGLAMDAAGNLYIADTGNHVIRKIDAATQTITTYAGTPGSAGFSGDNGQAINARLNTPWGMAGDANGNFYIADLGNSRIRKISPAGVITTFAGTGITEYADSTGLAPLAVNLKDPAAVLVDVAGNIYIANSGLNEVLKVGVTTGLVTVAAGKQHQSDIRDGGAAPDAALYGPYALTLDARGNLYIADIFHHRIREVQNDQGKFVYDPIRVGRTSPPQDQVIENDGNASVQWTTFTADQNATFDPVLSTCAEGGTLAINTTCKIAVEFVPQVTGSEVSGHIQIGSNAINNPGSILLTGESDELEPTKTTLVSTPNPSAVGAIVKLTASVTGAGGPTGSVKFFDGSVLLGTATLAGGSATFNVSTLTLGSHTITAAYTGDATNSPSSSPDLIQIVKQKPVVALVSSLNPSKVGQSVTLTATVSASPNMPTGNVVFTSGSKTLGTVAVDANGIATLTLSSLAAGKNDIIAAYQGDTNNLAIASTALAQQVNLWESTTTVASSTNPSNIGEPTTFTITVIQTGTTTPTGNVTLLDGPTVIATVSLDPQGVATYATADLTVGQHAISARYEGDSVNAASTSTAMQQTVQKIATTTVLASSTNPANGGATIRLTATVTASTSNATAGSLTGTVVFTEGGTTLGSGSISAGGVVTADVSSLGVGEHKIVAIYVGNDSYATSSSSEYTQTVQLATTSVQLASSDTSSIAGNKVLFTAVVSGDGGVPSGVVTFKDGTQQIGQATLNASGQATISLTNLTSGNHTIIAEYPGDAKNKPSTSAPLTQVVQQAVVSITLTSSANPAIAGTNVVFAAAISSSGSVPVGQLKLMDGGNEVAVNNIAASGTVQFSINSLSAGTHTLTAYFAGDADHAQASSAALTQVIKMAASAVVLTSNANPSLVGSPVTFTAKVTGEGTQPTGSVTFLDGTQAIGTAVVNGSGIATLVTSSLSLGNHAISVTYAGDATHNASAPGSLSQTVQQKTTTTLVSNLNPALVGDRIVFTVTVTGSTNQNISGTIGIYEGTSLVGSSVVTSGAASIAVTNLAAGSHVLLAKYEGDSSSQGSSSASLTQAVNTADTVVTLVSSANPAVAGDAIRFTATVASKGNSPTGSVTFLDGASTLGTAQVNNGVASLSVSTLVAGQHAIVARYGGDSGTQISTSSVVLQIVQQRTSVNLVSSVNPALTAQSMVLTAAVNGSNPGGSIRFYDGGTLLGTAILTNGVATFPVVSLSAGVHSLLAEYTGDSYNLDSRSTEYTQTIQLRGSSTSVTASSQTYIAGQQVTLVAVVQTNGPVPPGGVVTFTSNGQEIGTANVTSSGAATLVFVPAAKKYDVIASYGGDSIYLPSTSVVYTITMAAPGTTFLLSTDPPNLSLNSGEHQAIKVTVTSNSNFTDTLSLGCLDLPAYATCTFSKNVLDLSSNGVASADVVLDTGLPLGAGPRAPGQSGFVMPIAAFLGMLLFFSRRRLPNKRLSALLSMAILLLTGVGLTGCGNSISVNSTPAGTYTVRVIATGATTGLAQVANVTIVVK